jgi:hypothetical protein
MGHGKATFKQADLTRALRAVEKAGCDVVRAEIARDGRIVLVFKNVQRAMLLGLVHPQITLGAFARQESNNRGASHSVSSY